MRAEGAAYLEQIAVLPSHMRQGIGGQLMTEAIAIAHRRGHQDLVLTTYDHVPWNKPYYERLGFETIPADRVGPTLQGDLDNQRRYLPMPDHRIAMRLAL
jgi:predicted N-acetyltransferase YhbS